MLLDMLDPSLDFHNSWSQYLRALSLFWLFGGLHGYIRLIVPPMIPVPSATCVQKRVCPAFFFIVEAAGSWRLSAGCGDETVAC